MCSSFIYFTEKTTRKSLRYKNLREMHQSRSRDSDFLIKVKQTTGIQERTV